MYYELWGGFMYRVFLLLTLLGLTACNSLRCEFTHPDDMSPEMLQLCSAYANSDSIYIAK